MVSCPTMLEECQKDRVLPRVFKVAFGPCSLLRIPVSLNSFSHSLDSYFIPTNPSTLQQPAIPWRVDQVHRRSPMAALFSRPIEADIAKLSLTSSLIQRSSICGLIDFLEQTNTPVSGDKTPILSRMRQEPLAL
jgi:hypothetical protein